MFKQEVASSPPTFSGFEIQPAVVKRQVKKTVKRIEVLFSRAMDHDQAYLLLHYIFRSKKPLLPCVLWHRVETDEKLF